MTNFYTVQKNYFTAHHVCTGNWSQAFCSSSKCYSMLGNLSCSKPNYFIFINTTKISQTWRYKCIALLRSWKMRDLKTSFSFSLLHVHSWMNFVFESKRSIIFSYISPVSDLIRRWQFEVNIVAFLGECLVNNCKTLFQHEESRLFGNVNKTFGWNSRVLILVLSFAACGNKGKANQLTRQSPSSHVKGYTPSVHTWPAFGDWPHLKLLQFPFSRERKALIPLIHIYEKWISHFTFGFWNIYTEMESCFLCFRKLKILWGFGDSSCLKKSLRPKPFPFKKLYALKGS